MYPATSKQNSHLPTFRCSILQATQKRMEICSFKLEIKPKDTFPRLPKNYLDQLDVDNKTSTNLIAGCRGSRFHPITRKKVLDKFTIELRGAKWRKQFCSTDR
ncbi:hypothetical protein JTB14_029383 [Gonioctena quinquepunctata]|nr:hypothetical protein JTB14_029383 [Gonioctena quinquepunctata]